MPGTVKFDGTASPSKRTLMGRWNKTSVGLPFFSIGVLPYGQCRPHVEALTRL